MAAPNAQSDAPIEVSFPLPKAPATNIHLQLTNNGPNLVVFLTTASPESASASAPLGSFVYAMPNVRVFSVLSYAYCSVVGISKVNMAMLIVIGVLCRKPRRQIR
ncbi:hypothetical protein ACJQWK_06271 [Exserohilum turcicum]